MADTFTKIPNEDLEASGSWKAILVEKEHQPAAVKSISSYTELENQVASIDAQITSLGERKTVLEAEMVEVRTAASGSS